MPSSAITPVGMRCEEVSLWKDIRIAWHMLVLCQPAKSFFQERPGLRFYREARLNVRAPDTINFPSASDFATCLRNLPYRLSGGFTRVVVEVFGKR